jgi:hypothetical protein
MDDAWNKRLDALQEDLRDLKLTMDSYNSAKDASEACAAWTQVMADIDRIIDQLDQDEDGNYLPGRGPEAGK